MSRAKAKAASHFVNGAFTTLLGFAILLFWAVPAMLAGNATEDWIATQGTIVESSIVSVSVNSGRRGQASTKYRPELLYEYLADGSKYSSSKIEVGAPLVFKRREQASLSAQPYTQGSTPTVFYNPVNPAESVLKQGASWSAYLPLSVAGICMPIGILMMTMSALKLSRS
jgi:hypothetical protein